MPTDPAPIVLAGSGKFLGNDGAWSTFGVDVGTPAQTIQLLVSTSQSATWAVSDQGCGEDSDASNCTTARGGLYDASKSSTWFKKDTYQLNEALNLGYGGNEQNGTYGFDTISIGGNGGTPKIELDHQVIAGMATHMFYLGSIGLAPETVNFSNSGDSSPSFISSLKAQNLIPSLSYGYTAGASYKDQPADAQLILGGYDSARLTPNDLELPFANTQGQELQIGLQGITYTDSKGDKSMLDEGILTIIDSTVPYMWLPQAACDNFAKVFGLQWDPLKNLYTLNKTAHASLVKSNPTLTFTVASSNGKGAPVNITFPYAAFDLNATSPLVKSEVQYFPIQRGPDATSYTLGRTFLQEAYLTTNYEKSTFSLSQATFDNTPSHIVPIQSSTNASTGASPTGAAAHKGGKSGGFGTGAIAGVAIAIALVGIIVAVVAFVCMRKRRRARRNAEMVHETHVQPDMSKTIMSTARTSHDDPEPKKMGGPSVNIEQTEAPMTPPIEMDSGNRSFPIAGPSQAPLELPANRLSRTELSTPDLVSRELESPGLAAIRSELSTPEPIMPQQELPTPDPSHELPSPHLGPVDRRPPRPQSLRVDSSESESGFTRDGMSNFSHRRVLSQDSPRPGPDRADSEESIESPILGRTSTIMTDLDSPVTADPAASTGRSLPQVAKRPVHLRQDSDTWQTRLEMTSDESAPPSRFGTMKERKESGGSEDGTVSSLAESPVMRKPVPLRGSMDLSKTIDEGREHIEPHEKDERAKQ